LSNYSQPSKKLTHPIGSATLNRFVVHSQLGHLHLSKNHTKMEQFQAIEMPDANLLR